MPSTLRSRALPTRRIRWTRPSTSTCPHQSRGKCSPITKASADSFRRSVKARSKARAGRGAARTARRRPRMDHFGADARRFSRCASTSGACWRSGMYAVRASIYEGAWELSAIAGGTRVTYRLKADPTGRQPAMLAKSAIRGSVKRCSMKCGRRCSRALRDNVSACASHSSALTRSIASFSTRPIAARP